MSSTTTTTATTTTASRKHKVYPPPDTSKCYDTVVRREITKRNAFIRSLDRLGHEVGFATFDRSEQFVFLVTTAALVAGLAWVVYAATSSVLSIIA